MGANNPISNSSEVPIPTVELPQTQVAPTNAPALVQKEPETAGESGIKTAVIASIITIVLQFLAFNTTNINVLVAGIFMGTSKNYGRKTGLTYFISMVIFFTLNSGLIKGEVFDPRGILSGLIITVIGSIMLALIPLTISWVIRKIRKV